MLVVRSWPDLWMKDSKDEKMGDAITTFLQEEAGRLKHIQDVTEKHRDLCGKDALLVTYDAQKRGNNTSKKPAIGFFQLFVASLGEKLCDLSVFLSYLED